MRLQRSSSRSSVSLQVLLVGRHETLDTDAVRGLVAMVVAGGARS
jgi:hypothetical protein